ncbi:hypothetical protein FOZ62_020818, partial [Perkinsus olseni]
GGGYWPQQPGYGKGKAAAYPGQRWGDGPYGSRDGSWQQQGSKGKGGHFHKGGGGRKGKGKGGHRWHDVESMRDLPIQRFVQDDMVEDPWTSLYPKVVGPHTKHTTRFGLHLEIVQIPRASVLSIHAYPQLKEEHPDLYEKYAKYLDDQQCSPNCLEPCDA